MGKKNKPLDIDNLKINFKLQYIGILIGFGVAIGVNVATFNNMKNRLEDLTQITKDLDSEMIDQFDFQNRELNNKTLSIEKQQSKMEGKLEKIDDEIEMIINKID